MVNDHVGYVFTERKASVTELFTVAAFRSVAIKFSIQRRSNVEFSALKITVSFFWRVDFKI